MTDYVIMPKADYQEACDAIRAKTGKTDLIKSGDMAAEIEDLPTGGTAEPEIVIAEANEDCEQRHLDYVYDGSGTDGDFLKISSDTPEPSDFISIITADGTEQPITETELAGVIDCRNGSGAVSFPLVNLIGNFVYIVYEDNFEYESDDDYAYLPEKGIYVQITLKGWSFKYYRKGSATVKPAEELSYNIVFTPEAPEDTSKLWVKTDTEPEGVEVTCDLDGYDGYAIETLPATLPTVAYGVAAATVGTKIYLFGGLITNSITTDNLLSTINVFDTETNTIETLSATLPTAMYKIAAATVGAKIYLFGGETGMSHSTINVFDTETNTIETLSATLPTAAGEIAAVSAGTKIYLFGGHEKTEAYTAYNLSTINVFDTETNTIETLSATLPKETSSISAALVGTKIYLLGGYGTNSINVFDTETNTIETLSVTLSPTRHNAVTGASGTKIYLIGGYGTKSVTGSVNYFLSSILIFDTETNTTETLLCELPEPASIMASGVVGKKVYMFGGRSDVKVFLSTINTFTMQHTVRNPNTAYLQASLTKNVFELLSPTESDQVVSNNTLTIGVDGVYIAKADGYSYKANAYLYNVSTAAWELI